MGVPLRKWSSAVVSSVGTNLSLLGEKMRTNRGQELCSPGDSFVGVITLDLLPYAATPQGSLVLQPTALPLHTIVKCHDNGTVL